MSISGPDGRVLDWWISAAAANLWPLPSQPLASRKVSILIRGSTCSFASVDALRFSNSQRFTPSASMYSSSTSAISSCAAVGRVVKALASTFRASCSARYCWTWGLAGCFMRRTSETTPSQASCGFLVIPVAVEPEPVVCLERRRLGRSADIPARIDRIRRPCGERR